MATNFNITPLGGFNLGGAVAQLGEQFGQQRKEQQQLQQQQQMQELSQRAAQGDTQAIEQLYAINPNAAQAFEQRMFEGQQRKADEYKLKLAEQQKNSVDFIKKLHFLPEEQREAAMQMAVDDDRFDFDEEDMIFAKEPNAIKMFLGEVLKEQSFKSIFGDESKDGKPETTTDITNWRQYQKLKKTSPEDAKAFGQQSGFVTPEGKELSVHLQKRLSDASDLAAKSDANIGKYETLISDIAGANLKGGVFEGSWKESFKDITGNQDFVTDLRRQYAGIRGSQLVDNLPPGAASDKDIELALGGFPTDNATGEQLQSFLRGLVKLEGFKRDLNNFKSEYISEKGTERGMLKEWRKKAKDRVENPNVVEWGDM